MDYIKGWLDQNVILHNVRALLVTSPREILVLGADNEQVI